MRHPAGLDLDVGVGVKANSQCFGQAGLFASKSRPHQPNYLAAQAAFACLREQKDLFVKLRREPYRYCGSTNVHGLISLEKPA